MQRSSFKHILNNYNCVQSSSVAQLCKKINQSRSARLNTSCLQYNETNPHDTKVMDGKIGRVKRKYLFLLVMFFALQFSEITYQLPAQTGNTGRKRQHIRVLKQNPARLLYVSEKKQCLGPHKEQLKQQHLFFKTY